MKRSKEKEVEELIFKRKWFSIIFLLTTVIQLIAMVIVDFLSLGLIAWIITASAILHAGILLYNFVKYMNLTLKYGSRIQ